jgi:predicted nucleotidyltransferase
LQHIEAVNLDEEFLYAVAEVRSFGSYIDPTSRDFGDVDIAVHLQRRDLGLDDNQFVKRSLERARASGRAFSNFGQMLYYAEHEVMRFLKARKPHLALHRMDDLKRIGAKSVRLYPR